MIFAELFLMLIVILIAAEVFTNALEHLGEKLGISEGVTGSIFAAVGTALPETIVPLLALLAGTSDAHVNEEIGVGAILGAPLMLSTLSISLLAFAVLNKRTANGHFHPEKTGLKRDLDFFIAAFALATAALFVPHEIKAVRFAMGFAMIMIYFFYLMLTLRASKGLVADGHATEAESEMFICKLGLPNNMAVVAVQLLIGLGLLIAGAKGFISGIQGVSDLLGITPLLLSLLVIPIATELPEKINSVLWVRKNKDTLAFGNITGALVFQGTLLPAIGIMLTPWTPQKEVFAGVVITLMGVLWLRLMVARGQLRVWHVWVNGLMYITYLALVLK